MDGISEAIKLDLSKLPSLNPFKDISMGDENINFVTNQSFQGKEDPNFNDHELDDNDGMSEWENEISAFDVFNEKYLHFSKRNKNLKSQCFVFSNRLKN